MTVPNKLFLDRVNYAQIEFLAAFDQSKRFFWLEWHRRAYKTTTGINLLIRECVKNPKSKYVYVAPTQVWARNIVWDDPTMLWDALPDKLEIDWKDNGQKMLITFANGAMLKIGGSDEPDSLRGIDADGVLFDEWALHKPAIYTEVFRPIIAGKKKDGRTHERWAAFLYTPKGINHATQGFNIAACIEEEKELPTKGKAKKCKPDCFASRLTADESGIITRAELDKMLEEIVEGRLTQEEYDQEMQCRRVTDEERTLITSASLDRLHSVNWDSLRIVQREIRKIVAIDPAFGGDQCALKGFENGRVVDEKQVNWTMTHEVVFEAKEMARRIKTKNFIVDCIGNGKGVSDSLKIDEVGYHVQAFNSVEVCEDSDLYANKKAEAVGYCAQQIRQLKVEPVNDPETRRQLVGLSRYKIVTRHSKGVMIMRSSDETKKELGCSPDRGLCYVYGIYGLRHVIPKTTKESTYETRSRRSRSLGPMAM